MILLILFVLFCKYSLDIFSMYSIPSHPIPSSPINLFPILSYSVPSYPILSHSFLLLPFPLYPTLPHFTLFLSSYVFKCSFIVHFNFHLLSFLSAFFSCWTFPQQPIIYFLIWPFLFLIFTLLTSPFPLSLLPCLIWYLSLFCIKFSSFL